MRTLLSFFSPIISHPESPFSCWKKILGLTCCIFFSVLPTFAQIPLDPSKYKEIADSQSPQNAKSSADSTKLNKKKPSKTKSFPLYQTSNQAWLNFQTYFIPDTSNLYAHLYDPNYQQNQAWVNIGEPAGPNKTLSVPTIQTGINPGINPLGNLKKSNQNFNFYRVQAPLTLVRYTQGTGQSFAFNALHTQNFSPSWNVTLDYQSIINENMFIGAGLNSTLRNTFLGSNFTSPNKKFHQIIILGWNRLRRNENGGIKPSDFYQYAQVQDSTKFSPRTFNFYSPFLTSPAKSFFANNQHTIAHQYALSKNLKITQFSTFEKTKFQYADTKRDTNFYGKNYYQYANKTNDSSVWFNQSHQLGLMWNLHQDSLKNHLLTLDFQIHKAQYHSLSPAWINANNTHNFQSNGVQFLWLKNNYQPKTVSFQLLGNYTLSGYGKSAQLYKAEIYIHNFKQLQKSNAQKPLPKLSFSAEHNLQAPSLFSQQFASNHFLYQANLNHLTGYQKVNLAANRITLLASKKQSINEPNYLTEFNANVEFGTWVNPILSIDSIQPNQYLFNAQYTKFQLQFHQRLNHFHIYQSITYHKFKSNNLNNLFNMGIPELYSKTSLFLQYNLFHNAMLAKTGLDIYYTSQFTPLQYRPDAATFYYNTQQSFQSGNYAQIDWYISARIQSADIYFKIEHANELYNIPGFNSRYDYVLYHPMQPYRVRFGLQWKFYN